MASFAPAEKKEGGSRPRVGSSHDWVQRAADPAKAGFSSPLVQAAPECAACRAGGPAPCPACAGGAQMLQRQVLGSGNRGPTIQAKLTVGEPNDPYEQEADRVAEQVMTMPQSDQSIQREIEPKKEEERIQMMPSVQRTLGGNLEAGGNLEGRLNSSKGGGSPLPDDVRTFMEPRYGADFSQVRVHTGSESVQMNQDLNAQAFTHREDVYFGAGKAPAKDVLTAHELTHVVQQSGAEVIRADQSTGNCGLSVRKQIMEADPILRLALTIQRSTREELLTAYNEALSRSDWNEVAIRLNSFNDADIKRLVASSSFTKTTLIAVKEAALTAMPGWNARVVKPVNARLTALMGDQVLHASAQEIQDYLLHSPFLKAYISSKFSGGNPLEGHIHIDDDNAFRTACIAYTMRQGKTREESEALEPQQSAFRDGDDIHVRKNDGKFTTTIHESIHRFSSPEYQHRLSNNANEGATEYFTRIICKDQTLTFSASYPKQLNSTDLLVGASSKEMVADAFFNGALQALLTAVDTAKGAGTLLRWSLFMNTKSYAQADALMRNAQSTQSPQPSASVQPKLTIGQLNDQYEQEADRAAEQVMSMPPPATPSIQRQAEMEPEEVQTKPLVEMITPIVQRQERTDAGLGQLTLPEITVYGTVPSPKQVYDDADEASSAAVFFSNQKSIKEQREYAGWVFQNPKDKKYYFSNPVRGEANDSDPGPKPPKMKVIGAYHTHGGRPKGQVVKTDEIFSPMDKLKATLAKKPSYLGTPGGKVLKFTPLDLLPSQEQEQNPNGRVEVLFDPNENF